MAIDATGTPTSNGIPTFATSLDAPSGKGFNAAMAVIDTLITTALNTVVKKAGAVIGTRRGINFIQGSNVTLTVADDAANNAVNVTIAAASPGASTGVKYDHKTATTDVTISATTEGTAGNVITANAATYDGNEVEICFAASGYSIVSGLATLLTLVFMRDSTVLGQVLINLDHNDNDSGILMYRFYDTPTAASHTYSVKAFVDAGSVLIKRGAGGSGNPMVSYIRSMTA